jgi:KDO2-lipid IV(A) lauroyltransferase
LALLSHLSPADLARLTLEPQGYDQYREALAQGRGVIGVSAHFGNWYWPLVCAAVEGFKVNAIVRPLDNPLLDREMNRVLERWGVRAISRRRATVPALAALRRGEAVALMVDQNAARHGRFVPFFGTPAATLQGLDPLRRGSGAEVVAVHSRRLEGRHAVSVTWLRDLPTDPEQALLAVHRHFEAVIGGAKGDYFWLHPRWKLRPPGEPNLYPGLRV